MKYVHKSSVPVHLRCLCPAKHATVSMKSLMNRKSPLGYGAGPDGMHKVLGTRMSMAIITSMICRAGETTEGDAYLAVTPSCSQAEAFLSFLFFSFISFLLFPLFLIPLVNLKLVYTTSRCH